MHGAALQSKLRLEGFKAADPSKRQFLKRLETELAKRVELQKHVLAVRGHSIIPLRTELWRLQDNLFRRVGIRSNIVPIDILRFSNEDRTCAISSFIVVLSETAGFLDYIGDNEVSSALASVYETRASGHQSIEPVREAVGGYFAKRAAFGYQGTLGLWFVFELISRLPGLRRACTAKVRGVFGVWEESVINCFLTPDSPSLSGFIEKFRFVYLPRLLFIQIRTAEAPIVDWAGDVPKTLALREGGRLVNYTVRGALTSQPLEHVTALVFRYVRFQVDDMTVSQANMREVKQIVYLLVYERVM